MKKRLYKIFAFAACLALAVFGLAACGKKSPEGSGGVTPIVPPADYTKEAYPVTARTLSLIETTTTFKLSWDAAYGADGYIVTVNGDTVITSATSLNLRDNPLINLPSDKVFHVTIVATETGKNNSQPISKDFTAEGNKKLNNPKIKSYDNGILEWEDDGVTNYSFKVNGMPIKSNGSNYYTETSFDTNAAGYAGALNIEITAIGDGTYTLDSGKLSFGVNSAHSKMTMLTPAISYSGGVLSWKDDGGASSYRVVDLNRAAKIVYPEDAVNGVYKLDLSDRVFVYGVYPDSSDPMIESAEIMPVDINYLEGEGTAASPYLIKTAFDLRAIDYYETLYAEKIAVGAAVAQNYYKIVEDIHYLSEVDDATNINKLAVAFYGVLDGNGKTLSGINVNYSKGRWSLFDEVIKGAVVKNIIFDAPEITNAVISSKLPINASIATVAYNNGGTIEGIKVKGARYQAAGGEISGICAHNYGTVKNCEVEGTFKQEAIGLPGEACYEMAGIVLENKAGGVVKENKIGELSMIGGHPVGDNGDTYNNLRTVGGIVAVNRKDGVVSDNSYKTITLIDILNADISEFGGLVAYNAGTVTRGTGSLGTFNCTAPLANVSATVGKNDGKVD